MLIADIKKYRGYLPIKIEKEETINWLIELIGYEWKQTLWFDKYSKNYIVRYRFGNKNIAQIYLKDKSWKDLPLPLWIKFTSLQYDCLDSECWSWIQEEKQKLNIKNKKVSVKTCPDNLNHDLGV